MYSYLALVSQRISLLVSSHDLQDFVALVGAIGFTPMDFVLPIWLYLACRKPKGIWRWFNILIASFYSLIAVLGELSQPSLHPLATFSAKQSKECSRPFGQSQLAFGLL